jgi:hypothetical protein
MIFSYRPSRPTTFVLILAVSRVGPNILIKTSPVSPPLLARKQLSVACLTALFVQLHTPESDPFFASSPTDTAPVEDILLDPASAHSPEWDPVFAPNGPSSPSGGPRRANATMLMLARNSDINGVVQSVREAEDRFNREAGYPWVFLNEEPFTDDFISRVKNLISGEAHFGLIPRDHWYQPDWIDEDLAAAGRKKLVRQKVIYGGSVSCVLSRTFSTATRVPNTHQT